MASVNLPKVGMSPSSVSFSYPHLLARDGTPAGRFLAADCDCVAAGSEPGGTFIGSVQLGSINTRDVVVEVEVEVGEVVKNKKDKTREYEHALLNKNTPAKVSRLTPGCFDPRTACGVA